MEMVSILNDQIQQNLRGLIVELNNLFSEFLKVYEGLAKVFEKIINCPSFPVLEDGVFVNRAFVVAPNGLKSYQDKYFMTRFENEEWGIASGKKKLSVFETKWGKFGIQTCYDIDFGIGSKLLCEAGAEVIFAPSCTETLKGARARALENQCYVVVSQTVENAN